MRRKWLWTIPAVMLVALGVYSFYFHFQLTSATRDADTLLAETRGWRLRHTPGLIIQGYTQRFRSQAVQGDCSTECRIDIEFTSMPPLWVLERDHLYKISHILRGRAVRFWFGYQIENGRFALFNFRTEILLPSGDQRFLNIGQMPPELIEAGNRDHIFAGNPRLTSPRPGAVLQLHYTDDIAPDEWERAINFDTGCITRQPQCEELREFMPQAWAVLMWELAKRKLPE